MVLVFTERNNLLSIFLPFCLHFSFFLTSFFLFICSWCFTSHSRMIFFTNFKILFINIIAVLNIIGHKTLWKRRSLAVKLIFKASGSAREHRDALKITWYGNSRKRYNKRVDQSGTVQYCKRAKMVWYVFCGNSGSIKWAESHVKETTWLNDVIDEVPTKYDVIRRDGIIMGSSRVEVLS